MYFTSQEKQAIQCLATAMAMADGKVAVEELVVNSFFNNKFGISSGDVDASSRMSLETATSVVKNMSSAEKQLVCAYLGTILASDKNIDNNEMLLWSLLSMQCGFPKMSLAEAASLMASLS